MVITGSANGTRLPVPKSIAAQVADCLVCFNFLLVDLHASDEYYSSLRAFRDALGRFKIWSSNIGAHRAGQRSLDYRLRDASHLQEHVLRLLCGLTAKLIDAREISSGARVPWDQIQFSDSDSDDSEDREDIRTELAMSQDLQHETEMDQILAGANEVVTNLLRLSAAIRKPARHDQWLKFSEAFDTTPYETFDIAHVVAKYPDISANLAHRLGTALSRRRCYFKYREEHHNKLAAGLTIDEQDGNSTIASSLPNKHKDSTVSVGMLDNDESRSEGGYTTTSFATSIANSTVLHVPSLPAGADYEEHFECPLCFDIIIVKDRSAWKQHIYSDLQPYVCLWENCSLGRRMFSSRHEWLQHNQNYHCKAWTCCLGCHDPFADRQDLQNHYLSQHYTETKGQLERFLKASETQKMDTGLHVCPLCPMTLSTTKAYAKHAGKHLRELSLFVLPVYATNDTVALDQLENRSDSSFAIDGSEDESRREGVMVHEPGKIDSARAIPSSEDLTADIPAYVKNAHPHEIHKDLRDAASSAAGEDDAAKVHSVMQEATNTATADHATMISSMATQYSDEDKLEELERLVEFQLGPKEERSKLEGATGARRFAELSDESTLDNAEASDHSMIDRLEKMLLGPKEERLKREGATEARRFAQKARPNHNVEQP